MLGIFDIFHEGPGHFKSRKLHQKVFSRILTGIMEYVLMLTTLTTLACSNWNGRSHSRPNATNTCQSSLITRYLVKLHCHSIMTFSFSRLKGDGCCIELNQIQSLPVTNHGAQWTYTGLLIEITVVKPQLLPFKIVDSSVHFLLLRWSGKICRSL